MVAGEDTADDYVSLAVCGEHSPTASTHTWTSPGIQSHTLPLLSRSHHSWVEGQVRGRDCPWHPEIQGRKVSCHFRHAWVSVSLCICTLFDKEREGEREWACILIFSFTSQMSTMACRKEFNPDFPVGGQEPNYSSHHLLPPRDCTGESGNKEPKLGTDPRFSAVGHGHLNAYTKCPPVSLLNNLTICFGFSF